MGGFAIALAAQKVLGNLFGGAVLSLDQPFQVGDLCKCGDILGYVEEIGVRSTRIRSLDRTLVTIPNAKLDEISIENYMEREKIRLYAVWRLDLTTPLFKICELLAGFEQLSLANNNFHHDLYRIRLIGVSDLGFDIELFAFGKTTEWPEFVGFREQLFFEFLSRMEKLEIKLALPGTITYYQETVGANAQPAAAKRID